MARNIRRGLTQVGMPVSLFSVHQEIESILDKGRRDVIFPAEEGYSRQGFDGEPFGLRKALEAIGVYFVGSGYQAVSTASDKEKSKQILRAAGVPVPRGVCLRDRATAGRFVGRFLELYSCPAVIKPAKGTGGSRGVKFIPDETELMRLIELWLKSDASPVLIEEFIEGHEYTAWVIGVEPHIWCRSIIAIEKNGRPIYDVAAKAGAAASIVPLEDYFGRVLNATPQVPKHELDLVKATAVKAHRILGAYSYSRVDLIVNDGRAVVLELNTQPTLSAEGSLTIATGGKVSFGELLAMFVKHALLRGRSQ